MTEDPKFETRPELQLWAVKTACDAKNDNPACFNPEINQIVMAALEEQAMAINTEEVHL